MINYLWRPNDIITAPQLSQEQQFYKYNYTDSDTVAFTRPHKIRLFYMENETHK